MKTDETALGADGVALFVDLDEVQELLDRTEMFPRGVWRRQVATSGDDNDHAIKARGMIIADNIPDEISIFFEAPQLYKALRLAVLEIALLRAKCGRLSAAVPE